MYNRDNQLNMSAPFATYFLFGNFHSTTVTNNALVPDPFVFAAVAFVVFDGTEYAFAKQSVTFRLVCPVVNRFRFQYFSVRTVENGLGRSKADRDVVEARRYFTFFSKSHISNVIYSI